MKLETKIKTLIKLRKEILEQMEKREKYHPKDCPIRKDHYHLSQLFGGLGCWRWNCPFCGEESTE